MKLSDYIAQFLSKITDCVFVGQGGNIIHVLDSLGKRKDINEDECKSVENLVNGFRDEQVELQWLLDTTEQFCKDRAVHNAVLDGIKILDNKDKKRTPEAIPSILSEALAVSFDSLSFFAI